MPDFPTYFCRVATSATVGSGQYWSFQQRLEVPQVVSQGQTYTLSFWVRATSGTISAGTLSYGFSSGLVGFPELTTTWQKVTRTLVFGASQISGSYASAYLVYAPENTAAFSVDIANVQLEAGDTATPFEHRSYGAELALCQRYYAKTYDIGEIPGTNTAASYFVGGSYAINSTTTWGASWRFPVEMRASATATAYNTAGTAGSLNYAYLSSSGSGAVTVFGLGSKAVSFWHNGTASGMTGGDGVVIAGHIVASAEL